MEESNGRWKKW